MTLPEKLNILMAEAGINKSILSKESGIPYTTIDSIYKQGYKGIRAQTLVKLSNYFGVTVDYLVREETNDRKRGKGSILDGMQYGEDSLQAAIKCGRILKKYDALDANDREMVLWLLDTVDSYINRGQPQKDE